VNSMSIVKYYDGELSFRLKEMVYVHLLHEYRELVGMNLIREREQILELCKPFAVKTQKIGDLPYRLVFKIFGPYFAEKVRLAIRSIRNKP